MRMYDIIKKKRDGGELSTGEIEFFIAGLVRGDVPDYQASALCMAVFYRGMTERETADLTRAMAESGDTVDLSRFGDTSVDKHSTGGVGDKTTLVVAPLAASLGCAVAKMSGRGLGHTGGTVDKLESIPGYCTALSPEDFFRQVEEIGIAVVGQTGNLTPADKKLYALRDVTATVDSLPLIASSIMSKKLAAGAHAIVLDVKCGSGAFMKTPADARALAAEMVKIGANSGRRVSAVITNMDRPLGTHVGNALEVREAIEILHGRGDAHLREICLTLAAQMIALSRGVSHDEALALVTAALDEGKALAKFREWIARQGGDARVADDLSLLPQAAYCREVKAERGGVLTAVNAETVGTACVLLGAGRAAKDDTIDPAAGIVTAKTVGDEVRPGDLLATLYANDESRFDEAEKRYRTALTLGDTPPAVAPLVYGIVEPSDVR